MSGKVEFRSSLHNSVSCRDCAAGNASMEFSVISPEKDKEVGFICFLVCSSSVGQRIVDVSFCLCLKAKPGNDVAMSTLNLLNTLNSPSVASNRSVEDKTMQKYSVDEPLPKADNSAGMVHFGARILCH